MGRIVGMIDTTPVTEKLVTQLKSDDQFQNYTRIISHSGHGLVEAHVATTPCELTYASNGGHDDNPSHTNFLAPIPNGGRIALATVESCSLAGYSISHTEQWRSVSQDIAVIWQGDFDNLSTLTATYLPDFQDLHHEDDHIQNGITNQITALIGYFQQNEVDPVASVWALLNRLKGQYILAVLFAHKPDQIVVACNDHYISIGRNDDGVMCIGDDLNGNALTKWADYDPPILVGAPAHCPTYLPPPDHGFDHQLPLWPRMIQPYDHHKHRAPMQVYDDIFTKRIFFAIWTIIAGHGNKLWRVSAKKHHLCKKLSYLVAIKRYIWVRLRTWFENMPQHIGVGEIGI